MAKPLRELLWLEGALDLSDDPFLEVAHAVSEWVVTYVGPIFWIGLGCLFLVSDLAVRSPDADLEPASTCPASGRSGDRRMRAAREATLVNPIVVAPGFA